MSSVATESPTAGAPQGESAPQPARKPKRAPAAKKSKVVKKAKQTKKAPKPSKGAVPATPGTNKKAEVIALMKRAKGVSLTEIVEATGWQKHTVRGFVSILGSKGGEKVESSKNASGERVYKIVK